jgi:hypothetical protein
MQDNATALDSALARLTARTEFSDCCWLVRTGKPDLQYRHISCEGRLYRNHLFGWFAATGKWPTSGQVIGHTCDVRACWRNDEVGTYEVGDVIYERRGHLWLGTHRANALDMFLKGRVATGLRSGARRHPEATCRGSRHGRSKLTEADVRDIRARYAAGESQEALARCYRIGRPNISYIVLHKTWMHIE